LPTQTAETNFSGAPIALRSVHEDVARRQKVECPKS
jgi:hypothetical protein